MIKHVEIKGAARFAASLAAAVATIERLPEAPGQAGRIVADLASTTAPRRTGRLAGSVQPATPDGLDVDIGSDLIYAPVVHNGWAAHHIEPRPFLATALARSERQVIKAYSDDVQRVLGTVEGV